MTPIKVYKDISILYILATPQAAKDRLGEVVADAEGQAYLKVYVIAVAEKGRANKSIIAFLSKKLDISKLDLEITQGERDRRKQISVQMSAYELESRLRLAMGSLF